MVSTTRRRRPALIALVIVAAACCLPDVQRGDPAKMAAAILRLTEEPAPPMRLLLGSDAAWLAPQITTARAAEDAAWRELSVSTDRDGLGDFADTEVARMVRPAKP